MRVGIIADGQAESQALGFLVERMRSSGCLPLKPLYADMQPYAPPAQIVRASESRIKVLAQKSAERFIVLLDREQNEACPGVFAQTLQAAYQGHGYLNVSVVIKNRCFENWLIGDPAALRGIGGRNRVDVSDRILERIRASGADGVNGLAVLNGCIKDGYCKRSDAIEICKRIDPQVVAANSRSFRKFVKVLSN